MDNTAEREQLIAGAGSAGVTLSEGVADQLLRYREELLRWNQKVNLTAITDPREVLEKHFIDSLAVLPEVAGIRSLLDLGAGAGLPGIPLKLAQPELSLTLVDTVGKKVAFMKTALVRLGLVPGARAIHVRAECHPEREGLPRAEGLISRAFMDVDRWTPLAARYVEPGGRIIAMLGQAPDEATLTQIASASSLTLTSVRHYQLPWSKAERAVVVFQAP